MKAFGIEDPAALLVHMGMRFVHDFRSMDYNLVINKANPALTLGSPIAGLLNGGFEGAYSSGVAPSWGKTGTPTGTFQEQTTLPWSSSGSKAQEVIGNTNTNQPIMQQSITAGLTRYRTYKIKFKVKVTSGTLRVRVTQISPFVSYGQRDFVSGTEGEYHFYFANYLDTNLVIELFNASSSSLSFLIDDMTIEPLVNDTHLFMRSDAFSASAWDGRAFNFAGVGQGGFINWNCDRNFRISSNKFTALAITNVNSTPASRTVQSIYRADITNGKSMMTRYLNGAPNVAQLFLSSDGAAVADYRASGVDPFTLGRVAYFAQYKGSGSEKMEFDTVQSSGSFSVGSHPATLFDPVAGQPYLIGAFINASVLQGSVFAGKIELAAFDDDIFTETQIDFMQKLLKTYR